MELKNSDFKSGLDVKSGVVKSSKINITKTCENLGPRNLFQYMRNAVAVAVAVDEKENFEKIKIVGKKIELCNSIF